MLWKPKFCDLASNKPKPQLTCKCVRKLAWALTRRLWVSKMNFSCFSQTLSNSLKSWPKWKSRTFKQGSASSRVNFLRCKKTLVEGLKIEFQFWRRCKSSELVVLASYLKHLNRSKPKTTMLSKQEYLHMSTETLLMHCSEVKIIQTNYFKAPDKTQKACSEGLARTCNRLLRKFNQTGCKMKNTIGACSNRNLQIFRMKCHCEISHWQKNNFKTSTVWKTISSDKQIKIRNGCTLSLRNLCRKHRPELNRRLTQRLFHSCDISTR